MVYSENYMRKSIPILQDINGNFNLSSKHENYTILVL